MFCGLIIKPGQKVKLDSTQGEILHLSQACLFEPKDNGRVYVQAIDNDKAITICSLQKGTVEHANLDLFLSTSTGIQLSVIGKNEVHISGFYEPEMDEDEFDDDDALIGLSDEEDKEVKNLDNKKITNKNSKRKLPTKSEESTDEEVEDEEIDSDEADDLDLDELIQDDEEDEEMEGAEDEDEDEDEDEEEEEEDDDDDDDEDQKVVKMPVVKNKNKQSTTTSTQKSKQENQPPSKKSRIEPKSQSKPDQIYEESIIEFLKKNGRTNLAMIGNKIKRPEGVSKKLGSFIAERTDIFKVENNMISLVK